MKKISIILLFSFCTLNSIFASSANVQLTTTIEDTNIIYQLYYDDNHRLISGDTNEIIVDSITTDGQTEDFYINATYNKNKGARISVDINAGPFKTTINGNEEFNSNIIPDVFYYHSNKTKLDAGKHKDKTVFKFYFYWSGNSELPSGNYISNVVINYSIV